MAFVGVLQHFWCEGAGVFKHVLEQAGHAVEIVPIHKGAPIPSPRAFDAWIIMGGPMNVDDVEEHAWIAPEKHLITQLIEQDRPVIGICLGAQLIASAAGARVYPKRPKEIGLFDIEVLPDAAEDPLFKCFDERREVFQWHGDTFDLPDGAVQLARSPRFEQQAFRIGQRVYGLQFHLECTEDMVGELCKAFAHELANLPEEDRFEQFESHLPFALVRQNRLAQKVILNWVELFDEQESRSPAQSDYLRS